MSSAIVRVADLWHPWNWPARVIAGSFFAVQVIMAITAMVQMGVVGPNLLGLALFALSFVLVLGRWGNALPRRIAWTVCLLMLAVVAVLGPYGFSTQLRVDDWYVGCAMVVMMALMMWDRPLIAFATFAMFTAVQLFWSASSGIPFGTAGPIMLRHAGTLLMTFAIARGFRQLARQLSVTAERRARREREDAVRNAIATERSLQAARIEATAGPILRRLQSGNPLTAEERRECLLIEATVRDAISGRGWATASVLDAARAARERGVTVVLLDEARDGTRDVETARTALVATLDTLTQGRCVARLVPTGRDVLASILVDDLLGNTRVLEVQRRY